MSREGIEVHHNVDDEESMHVYAQLDADDNYRGDAVVVLDQGPDRIVIPVADLEAVFARIVGVAMSCEWDGRYAAHESAGA